MRKLISIIGVCAVLTFQGCSNVNRTSQAQAIKVEPLTQLDILVDSAFAQNPDAMNNAVTRSMLADTLKSRISQYQGGQLPFLAELPMEYEMCLPYNQYSKYAGKYVVKFSYSGRVDDKITTFQVFTRMDKEQVANLVDHAKYHVNGTFLFYPDNTQEHWFELPSGRGVTDNPSITTSTTLDNSIKPFVNLGTLIFEDVTFTKI